MLIKWFKATKIKMTDGTRVYFENKKHARYFKDAVKSGKSPKTWTVNDNVFGAIVSYDGQTGEIIEDEPSKKFMENYEPTAETLRIFSRAIAASLFLLAVAGAIETVIIEFGLIGIIFWIPLVLGINYLRKWNKGKDWEQWKTTESSSSVL